MITVIGGGAIGLSTAYLLHKAGYEVQVIEQTSSEDTSGCSYGNAGMIVPSHFMPLAAPGVIRQSLKWLFDNKSPLYIKPRLDRDLIEWLWLFLRSANDKNVKRVGSQLFQLNKASRDLYSSIIKEENFEVGFERKGLMMLYQTEAAQAEEEHLAEKAQNLGIEAEILNADQVQKLEPNFELKVRGGVHYFSDAHLNPGAFMKHLKEHLINAGVTIHYDTSFLGIRKTGREITHIQTNCGDFTCKAVVVASGAWSQVLSKELNLHLPLQGGKGYSMTVQNTPRQLQNPSILCERKIALTPMGASLRIAGTMEIAGTNRTITESRLKGLKEGVGQYLRNFDSTWLENTKPWTGLRPVSPDGLPYIGKSAAWNNLFINTGHAMMGMSLAPISGKILLDIIDGKKMDFNTEILSPDRFK